MRGWIAALLVALLHLPAAAQAPVEATSFLGEALTRPELPADARATQERLLAEAQAALAANPNDADAAIWVGRRLGYLGRYGDAIAGFEAGAERHPRDARFPRHLGHRLISVRRIDDAIAALERAAALVVDRADEVEPDGLPNAANIPTSTLKGNIYYHLALAYYLDGQFQRAARVFAQAVAVAENADSAAASGYWLYLSLRRAGDADAARAALAPIDPNWTIIENNAYHRLALCFKGALDCATVAAEARSAEGVQSTTLAYGLAIHALIEGRRGEARTLMREIEAQPDWASFGHIAAEADLARGLRLR